MVWAQDHHVMRRRPDQRAEATRRQVRGSPARTAEPRPRALPLGFAAVAARWQAWDLHGL
jgi:hypothetical protein